MTELVKKKQEISDIVSNDNEGQCVELLKGVYEGKFWLMPLFAQYLVSFLYEDMPENDNPRVAAHHIATRGMYVLQKAYQLSESEDQKLQIQNEEHKEKETPYLLRESLLVLAGILYGKTCYFSFLLSFACICSVHPLYNSMSSTTKQYMTLVYVIAVAYTFLYTH
jgi:hypothetical protein